MSDEHVTYTVKLPRLERANVIGPAGCAPRMIRFGDGVDAVALIVSPDMPVRILREGRVEVLAVIERRRAS